MFLDLFLRKKYFSELSSIKNKVLSKSKETEVLSDLELKESFFKIKKLVEKEKEEKKKEEILNKNLIEAFSIIKEIIRRKTGLTLFSTQVLSGIALHFGNISQMNTGEGKTLSIFLPACLNSIVGTVFIITVNEYLANRDWNLAKPTLDFLNIDSAFIPSALSWKEKKTIYETKKIIYTTGQDLGFDYLHNSQIKSEEELIKLNYYYVIIDEADSILLDESCQNLNLNGYNAKHSILEEEKDFYTAKELVNCILERKKDYKVDENKKISWITPIGAEKCQKFYKIKNIFSFENQRKLFLVTSAIKAKHFFFKNIDYVVGKNRIILINNLTGRLAPISVFSYGIQQSIECKEDVRISKKGITKATITFQNFFRIFRKISGTTGTAETERDEFWEIYGLKVVVVPPYKKLIRKDYKDVLLNTKKEKYEAIKKKIVSIKKTTNQPILIGTSDVEISQTLSDLLNKEKINHYLLNAVNHEKEAEIISKGGEIGSVIISTNMAGRGTDIKLDEESKKKGGLFVIGVENYFSQRERLQLIGRSGRQGDEGSSQFFVSLEDEIIKKFEMIKEINSFFNIDIGKDKLFSSWISTCISQMQETLSKIKSEERKNTLNYDLLINHQRKFLYDIREKILCFDKLETLEKILGIKKKKNELHIEKETYWKKFTKVRMVNKIDEFWSEYLEIIERTKQLINLKIYAKENPIESFFQETLKHFENGYKNLNSEMKKILFEYL